MKKDEKTMKEAIESFLKNGGDPNSVWIFKTFFRIGIISAFNEEKKS